MAILKQKPLFVRIEFTENMFYASIHFPNLQLLSFGQKVGNLVYCLKARKDCLSWISSWKYSLLQMITCNALVAS